MSMRINGKDPAALGALRHQETNRDRLGKTLEKLGSGQRINRAADDAAGMAIADEMGQTLKSLEHGLRSLDDGLSLLGTADGGLGLMSDNLQRMRDLAVTAASDTISPEQRAAMQGEFHELRHEIDRQAAGTTFNGKALLDGTAGTVEVPVGEGESVRAELGTAVDAAALGLDELQLAGEDGQAARAAVAGLDLALADIDARRAELGAAGNRFESARRGLAVGAENAFAARSRVVDADQALEVANRTRQMMLEQMGVAAQLQARGLQTTALNLLE